LAAAQTSLNTLKPDNVAHGADILIQGVGPAGTFVTLAEVKIMDFTVDDDIQVVGQMGTRRNGAREGRIKITGTLKNWFLNSEVFSMWLGSSTVVAAGSASIVYGSQATFNRYNIRVALAATSNAPPAASWYNMTFVNVVFEKQMAIWDMDKLSEETISWQAEDVIYNSA
jgi:hypothetical protein